MPDFTYCLNTSTIRPAALLDKIKFAAEAGFTGVELWIPDVFEYIKDGKPLADIKKALDDAKLKRPSMIALWGYTEADAAKYKAALDQMKRTLEAAAELAVERIVVSPPRDPVDLQFAGRRYKEVLDLSRKFGVPASVEFLGFVKSIYTTAQAWEVASAASDPRATITPDTFHIFRGGGRLTELDAVPADHISIFHWNDVPAAPEREKMTDADRVMPGDGVLDLKGTAGYLKRKGYKGFLSLELFNRSWWTKDAKETCKIGLEKMRKSVEG
jgi:sugar phosphate isomerase/epimerase